MKKKICLFVGYLLMSSFIIRGQNSEFEEILNPDAVTNISEFANVKSSSFDYADVDGDDDLDVLLIGIPNVGDTYVTTLYLNDGLGGYTEVSDTPFISLAGGTVDFFDVDGDEDPDLLITGRTATNTRLTKLYLNNGSGIFTEAIGTPFSGVVSGAVAYGDVDGDEDVDLFVTGHASSGFTANLYLNNGTGVFTYDNSNAFTGVSQSSVALEDLDGDGDLDLLYQGRKSFTGFNSQMTARTYVNDGLGNFSFSNSLISGLQNLHFGTINFADIDGDADRDLFITGQFQNGSPSRWLFINNGSSFSSGDLYSTQISKSSVKFGDIEGDGDDDIVMIGEKSDGEAITELYVNDGAGNFTIEEIDIPGLSYGGIGLFDMNGDDDLDVLVSGRANSLQGYTGQFFNLDDQWQELNGTQIRGSFEGTMAVSDIDLDGDLDLLVGGKSDRGIESVIYLNDGSGVYEVSESNIESGFDGAVVFVDIDQDGDEDLLVNGFQSIQSTGNANASDAFATIYRNTDGIFTEITENDLIAVGYSDADFGDVDSDGDLDLFVVGFSAHEGYKAVLYLNGGTGIYTESTENGEFVGVLDGSVSFVDYDQNGDLDIVLSGFSNVDGRIVKLYENDGAGNFSEEIGAFTEGLYQSSQDFADIDDDGDLDCIITGNNASSDYVTILFQHTENGIYTVVADTPFENVTKGEVSFEDIDKDGDADVFVLGENSGGIPVMKLYLNDGSGNFTEDTTPSFEGASLGSILIADVDNDGFSDLLYNGLNADGALIGKVYRNQPYLGTNYYVSNPGQGFQDGSNISNAAPNVSSIINETLLRDSVKVISGTITETTDFSIPKNVHVWLDNQVSLDTGGQTITNEGHVTLSSIASFVQSSGAVIGNGNFEVIREAGTEFSLYNLLASPVQDIDVQQVYGGSNVVTYAPSQQDNGAGGWSFVYTGALQNGRGYAVNGSLSSNFAGLRHYIGKPNNGDVSFTLDGNTYGEVADGWNLLGNPYPSAIDMTAFLTSNADVGAITFYDQSAEMYVTYNLLNASGLTIASGQGFFVEFSLANSGTATFSNTQRQQLAGAIERQASVITVTLNIQDEQGGAYSTLVGFVGEASDGFDVAYDAKLMPGASDLVVYSLFDEIPQAIQGFSTLEDEKVVPIGVKGNAGNYIFTLGNLVGMDGVEALLHDTETDIVYDVEASGYSFTHSFDGADDDRFSLIFRKESLDIPDSDIKDIEVFVSGDLLTITGKDLQFVSLYNVTGKQLLHENVSGDSAGIYMTDFAVGIYFVELGSGNYKVRKKVQIVK